MNEQALLQTVLQGYRRILGHRLSGFYVHGSIAFGCFTWETGDIDFLAVVTEPLTQGDKEAIIRLLLSLTPDAPKKGFEMSVVLQDCCRSFRHPMPFELHYSNAHRARAEADLSAFCREMHGEDPDLAAHVTVVRRVGLALCGPAPREMFSEVPPDCYRDSILSDIAGAETEIAADPVYLSLNLCRVLAFAQDGAVLSKQQGGEWGLAHLPERYHPLLRAACASYADGCAFTETACLQMFAGDMLARIRHAFRLQEAAEHPEG